MAGSDDDLINSEYLEARKSRYDKDGYLRYSADAFKQLHISQIAYKTIDEIKKYMDDREISPLDFNLIIDDVIKKIETLKR